MQNISSELLSSFGRQLTKTGDIPVRLNDIVLNGVSCSKEGDACQEEKENSQVGRIKSKFTFQSWREGTRLEKENGVCYNN